jgi:hypothetical protein
VATLIGPSLLTSVQTYNLADPDPAFHVRVGLHAGHPIRHEDDYFGMTVIITR